jgi:hypothetical protein
MLDCYKPTIQTTTLEILQSYRNSLTCSQFVVNYARGKVSYVDKDGLLVSETISSIVERTKEKAISLGYNFELVGGLYEY